MNNKVDLTSGWNKLWSAISGVAPEFWVALTMIGVGLIIFATGKWALEKYTGRGGQGGKTIMWALVVGCLLAAPAVLIPLMLGIFELIISLVVSLFDAIVN